MPDTTSDRLGPHEIDSPIGAGKMGKADRPRDSRLNYGVAIKSVRTLRGHVVLAVKLAVPLFLAIPAILIGGSTPSSVTLSSSPNASVFGHPVTLAAVVAPPTATGSVTFYDGTTVLGTSALTAGQATFSTIFLPSGPGSLKAYYGGDTNYVPSTSSTLVQTVQAVPGGGFAAVESYATGANPGNARGDLAVGDFNGDGKADLAVAEPTGNEVGVLLGNGDGTFQSAVSYFVPSGPVGVAVGDFNGDGKADLVTINNAGSVSVLLGNGDGTFQSAVSYFAGGPPFVAVGDFNGDGKADLVTSGGGRK